MRIFKISNPALIIKMPIPIVEQVCLFQTNTRYFYHTDQSDDEAGDDVDDGVGVGAKDEPVVPSRRTPEVPESNGRRKSSEREETDTGTFCVSASILNRLSYHIGSRNDRYGSLTEISQNPGLK